MIARLASRYARQVTFVADRLRPGTALGLLLTVQLVLLVALGAAFGTVFEDVVPQEELISLDAPLADFVVAHRAAWLTGFLETVTWAGSAAVLVPVIAAVGLLLRRATQSWRPLLFLAACLAGASVLSNLIKLLVARARPDDPLVHAIGYAFPSGHATSSTAGWLGLAIVVAAVTAGRRARTALFAVALLVIAIVGFSRVYLRVHETTDVLGGWALGGAWVAIVLITTTALDQRRPA